MIIGTYAKAQSGKNTLSSYLIEIFKSKYDTIFVELAFAGLLKGMCAKYFDLSSEQLYGDKKEAEDERYFKYYLSGYGILARNIYWTPREIMQEVGSFFRKIDKNFWINNLDEFIRTNNVENAIITDVRHINECEYVKKNGILIKIIRPETIQIHGMQHESETALDNKKDDYFDVIVNNDGSLDDLRKASENLADAVFKLDKLKQRGV